MRKFYLLSVCTVLVCCAFLQQAMAQTVVYTNPFPGVGGLSPFPPGTPPASFTITSASTDASPGSGSGVQLGGAVGSITLTDNQLAIWTTVAHTVGTTNSGHGYAVAPLSGYSAPFNPTLTANAELITWTFNMRLSVDASGLGTGMNGAAVVLVADDPNVRTAGSGYAVTYNPAFPSGFQLVRYSGGLTGTLTPLISSAFSLSIPTNYASVKVLYEPATDQWNLYLRDDGTTAFADPSTGVTALVSSAIDATLTGTAMTHFGFYANNTQTYATAGPDAQNAYFDNFTVSMSCPEIEGGTHTCVGLTTTLSHPTPGGTWVSSTPSVATVSASGVVTGVTAGTSTITYTVGSCEVVAVVTVSPPPIPPAVSGVFEVCVGATTPLSISSTGGTWSSSTPAIGSVSSTGVVAGISAGTVNISYTVPTGCFSIAEVTVNPIAPITGVPVVCLGDFSTLYDPVAGGTWESDDVSVVDIDPTTGVMTGVSLGTATISYTMPTGCMATTIVTVNASPTPITGTPTVCEGSGTPLSSGPAGGFWSSSNETVASVSGTGLVVGNSPGTSIITYKLPSGCQVTLEITVNAQPTGIGGTTVLCEGQTSTLTNALAGGTWESDDVSVATIDLTSGLLTAVSAGTCTITYMMPTGCFRTTTVTVNIAPAPITGATSVCVGLTTLLTSSTGGVWSSSSATTATVVASSSTTGTVTGLLAGTVNISYTLPSGCYRMVNVTVTPLPAAIGGTATVCTGRTTTLTNTSIGGTWTSADVSIATVGSGTGTVLGVAVGTVNITYTIGTGCTQIRVVTVIASPAVITGIPTVCVGNNTTLSSTTSGGTWSSSNTAIGTVDASSGSVYGVTNGTVTITYTASNGCFATTTVTVNPLPGAIGGTLTVCVNAQTTLTATPGGGAWSSGDITVASIGGSSGVAFGNSAGTAGITYTRFGCSSTAVLTVNPVPASISGPTQVCMGSSITLTDITTPGTWISSNTGVATIGSSSGTVTPVSAGTTTITYRLTTTGCFRTRTTTVNALPPAIGGSTTVCPASNVTLTNTTGPGTWVSGNTGIATVVSGTGVVTGVATGTAPITYTVTATGCTTSINVTVSSAPPAIITALGDTVLCPGDFITLAGTTSPGVTYEWLLGTTPISGATNSTYIVSTGGTYRFRVNVAVGCSSTSTPMNITMNPATATITVPGGTTATCAGTPVTLNANTGTGLTYQWMLSGSPISGATASTYNALAAGPYTVRVTNSAGCWAVSAPTSITVDPAPSNVVTVSGPLTFCAGNSVTLSAATGTGYTYQWYNSGGIISGATSSSYTATTSDRDSVVITSGAGCVTTTAASIIVVNPLPNAAITPGGPRIFCTGGSVVLDATPGFNYQWYRNGTAIPGATSASYTAMLTGGYRVRVTNTATGCTALTGADTTVTAVSTPTIIPLTPAMFCWGGSSLLTTSASSLGSAINYQWTFNGVPIPGATVGTYNATAEGDYACTVSVPASCTMTTSITHVTEMPLPDPLVTFDGTTFHTGTFYVTYQWYKNLIPITGATTATTLCTGNGNYKVAVTDTNGCQSMSAVYVLTGWVSNGVSNVNSTEVRIYPNPASLMVHIESAQQVRAVIASVDGKAQIDEQNAKNIDISKLANGVYMIMIYDQDGDVLKTEKLVKASE